MKKVISLFIALVMVVGSVFALSSCGDSGLGFSLDSGGKTVVGELSFTAPDGWIEMGGDQTIMFVDTEHPGTSLTVTHQETVTPYEPMTTEKFDELRKDYKDDPGVELIDASYNTVTNAKGFVTDICMFHIVTEGKEGKMGEFVVDYNGNTYIFMLVGLADADFSILNQVFATVSVK